MCDSIYMKVQNRQIHGYQISGSQEHGEGANEGCLLNWHGVSFGGDANVLKLGVMAAQRHEHTKHHGIEHFKVVKMVDFMLCECTSVI